MKYLNKIHLGGGLAAAAAAVVSLPVFAASHGLCGPDSCVLVADLLGSGTQRELFYRTNEASGKADWYDGTTSISGLGGVGWQPNVGDYNNDGFDDLAVYKDGVFTIQWNVNGTFIFNNTTTYSLPTFTGWGGNTIPVSGDWDGMGGDDLGIYTDGTFRLFPDETDFNNIITISFGYMPQNAGFAFTQMPFSGPIDNDPSGIDRVGIFFGTAAQYAPQTVDSTFDFMDRRNTSAMVATIARPDFYARPHILELQGSEPQFTFMMPPDLPAMNEDVCEPHSGFVCESIFPARPDTEQPVVIVPDPFQ